MIRPNSPARTMAAAMDGSLFELAPGVLDHAGGAVAADRREGGVVEHDVLLRRAGVEDPVAVDERPAVDSRVAVDLEDDPRGVRRVDAVDHAVVVGGAAEVERA